MKYHYMLLALAMLLSFPAMSGKRTITESDLVTLSKEQAPQIEEIRAALLSIETQRNIIEEKYAPELFGRASYAETQERPIIEFLPVFSPIKQAQIGVRKKFSKGIETQLLASADQRSASSAVAGSYNNVTTTLVSFTVQMDLWKDLLGKMSDAERKNAEIEAQRAKLENEIKTRVFELSLRRIYWSLVATEEQLTISERLKVTATQQLNDAKKRLQNSIGDVGDVARYEAQVASRTGQIIYLSYQKESLLKQLKTLLPAIALDEVVLGTYDIDKTIFEVLECSQVITKELAVPYQNTKYDEMVALLREVRGNNRQINERYSDIDVKLFGTVKSTGIGSDKLSDSNYRGSYGDAYRDMTDRNRTGYEAGLTVSLPLGDAKASTKKTKELYDEKRLKAMIDGSDSQVVSTHIQLAKSMRLINEVIASQRMSTKALEKRLSVIRQKYAQARVSVGDLIQDQDALLNSEISTIDAQLQAVNVLFDYLMVFTETPCNFNRI